MISRIRPHRGARTAGGDSEPYLPPVPFTMPESGWDEWLHRIARTVNSLIGQAQNIISVGGGSALSAVFNDVGRNLIHNPLFNIAQRGTNFSTSGYTLDRWRLDLALDTATISAANISGIGGYGDEAAQQGLSVNVTGNAGAGAFTAISQFIENVRRLSGKTVTVSFWAYATSGSPKIGVAAAQVFGTGGSPSATVSINGTATPGLTSMPVRYSVTFAYPSAAGKTLGTNNDHYSQLSLYFSSGATNNTVAGGIGVQTALFVIWGVQLEIGSVATPLEKPDPQQDLAKCQRFYQSWTSNYLVIGYMTAGGNLFTLHSLPTTMRVPPAVGFSNLVYTNGSGLATAIVGPDHLSMYIVATAAGQAYVSGNIALSADL